ncbi:hypothetical protein F5888DRAFT_1638399 [Russula emetica]|nr:hypothetical protein F5888DRAFT_1638399 [Russula emetica]
MFLTGKKLFDWKKVKSQGVAFAYIKATEGTGSMNNSIIRGAYHFAGLSVSSGVAQSEYFLAHGGGWTGDGITLPGAIDLEGLEHEKLSQKLRFSGEASIKQESYRHFYAPPICQECATATPKK